MKKLISVLFIALVALVLVACGDTTSSQTTTFISDSNSSGSQSTENNTTTTIHTHSGSSTTQTIDGSSEETSDNSDIENPNGNEDEVTQDNPDTPDNSTTSTTTSQGQNITTTQPITTTTKKDTSTNKSTTKNSTTTTTTKKTTTKTTTTKKVTTTLNSNTVKNHTFSKATYTKVDINYHKAAGKCSVCGISTIQSEMHSWGSWKYDSYPTSKTDGVKYRVCTGCGEEQVTIAPATSVNTANFAQEVFELVNAERAKYGLPPFTYYTAGQAGANTRAKEIMAYFSHTRPDGTKWWTVSSFDRSICQAGAENIARGYGGPKDVVAAFMASADHRTNILSTKYTHIVVSYYEGAWVQIFTKPW